MGRQAAQESIPNSRLISASVKTRPALWSARPSSIARIASSVNSSSVRLARRRAGGSSLERVRADGIRSSFGILHSPQLSLPHDHSSLPHSSLSASKIRTSLGCGTYATGAFGGKISAQHVSEDRCKPPTCRSKQKAPDADCLTFEHGSLALRRYRQIRALPSSQSKARPQQRLRSRADGCC